RDFHVTGVQTCALPIFDALRAGDRRALDPAAAGAVRRAATHLARLVDRRRPPADDPDEALAIALLAGFPDRVARRRRPGAPDLRSEERRVGRERSHRRA